MEELTHQRIQEKLTEKFGDAILKVEEPYNLLTFTIKRESLLDILRFVYNDQELEFQFLTDITGVHFTAPEEVLGAVYHLHNLPKNKRIRLKAFFPKNDPVIDSATPVFSGANWMERETYDFFGIQFKGHPNLKRILNVDDLGYFPLRKEYALEDSTRTDKDDSLFGR
ncbi:MAG: NADH-quinone oxidoreductase subunit C [Sporocytophaga sp.]|nr:NADH-quinone oxidoreductase subunit C [Sporocytophaga sp.]